MELKISNLHVSVEGKEILKGLNLTIRAGEVHALMGKNGSGKTSLSYTLMGHPRYQVTGGDIELNGKSILTATPDERAKQGIFLAFQNPVSIPGVGLGNFLRASVRAVRGEEVPAKAVRKLIRTEAAALQVPDAFLARSLNDGFSGGEKKRIETLQMKLLQPKLVLLDEMDSGLDLDALKMVGAVINELNDGKRAFLLITHYQRMLELVGPKFIHILSDGKIVKSGGMDLITQLEKSGFESFSSAEASVKA